MDKRKRINTFLILCVFSITIFALTGCESLDYSPEEEDIIANYAANLVLRHDANYKYDYITEEETTTIPETTKVVEEETSTPNGDGNTSITTTDNLSAALQLPAGVVAEYLDYDVVSQYPNDTSEDIFVLKALENNKLLVVKFKFTNNNSQDVSINMMSKIQKYKGIVNDSKRYNAQLTLLLDALNTYEGTIKAGTSQTFVLVYQTQLDTKEDVKTLAVAVTDSSDKEVQLNLK